MTSIESSAQPTGKMFAQLKGPDGKVRNMGRIDRKWWAPRAWYYRFVTFPRLVRNLSDQ